MKITKTNKWMYNDADYEIWDISDEFDSKQEAIEAGKQEYCGEEFYVGRLYSVKFEKSDIEFMDMATQIIENLSEGLYDVVGEVSDSWSSSVTNDMQKDLNARLAKTIMNWIESVGCQPEQYQINDIELIEGKEE